MITDQAIPVFTLPDLAISFYVGEKMNLKCHITTPYESGDYDLGVEIESLDVLETVSDHWQASVLRMLRKMLTHEQAGAWLGADLTPDAIGQLLQRYCLGGLLDAGRMAFNTMRPFQPFPIPSFDLFLHAFQHYAEMPIDGCNVTFHANQWKITVETPQGELIEVTTAASRKTHLFRLINGPDLMDLPQLTFIEFWQQVGTDDYSKSQFLPLLLQHWRDYWDNQLLGGLADIYQKQESWTELSTFMHCYDSTQDHVGLSAEFGAEQTLLPLVIKTLLGLFDAGACLEEYVGLEFAADFTDQPPYDEVMLTKLGQPVSEEDQDNHPDREYFYCRILRK